MKRLMGFLILAVLAIPSGFAAVSPEMREWGNGPAQLLMTAEEKTKWERLSTDEEAREFIALFWARRDPTPTTQRNEFQEAFEARAKFGDENFAAGRTKGSMTPRGKTLLMFGAPTRRARTASQQPVTLDRDFDDEPAVTETWIYEGEQVPQFAGHDRFEIIFVDERGTNDFTISRGTRVDVSRMMTQAATALMVSPDLTAPPAFERPATAAPVAAPVPSLTEEMRAAIAAAREADQPSIHVTWGEFVTPTGQRFVPVQLYVPAGTNLSAEGELTFFGVVETPEGNIVEVYTEPMALTESTGGMWFDRSLALEPGSYVGSFGIASNGKPVAVGTSKMEIRGLEATAPGVSQLILSNQIYPLPEAQLFTDPYAFGGLKVVPKGDLTFGTSEEMWYFIELRNPGLGEDGTPSMRIRVDLEGTTTGGDPVKMRLPMTPVPAQPLKGVDGHYAIGNSIPLESFRPGDYTMRVRLVDSVLDQTYELERSFTVVK